MMRFALPLGAYLRIRDDGDMVIETEGREIFIGYCTLTDPKELREKLDLLEETERNLDE